MSVLTPNMNLVESAIGVDTGLAWEQNLNTSLSTIDQHNHSAGQGVQINPSGININSSLAFNNQQATSLQAAQFTPQSSVATLDSIYFSGVDFYVTDGNGNPIQITSGGAVNATSSGIVSGTASASFSGGVLVVNAATNTPANIQAASYLMGLNSAGTNYLTLSPPAALSSGSYPIVLPATPGAQSFLAMDTSGNITNYAAVSGGITGAMIAPTTIAAGNIVNGTITTTQISSTANITGSQLSSTAGITGGQLVSSIVLGGAPQIGSNYIPQSPVGPTIILWDYIAPGGGSGVNGSGISAATTSNAGTYTVTFGRTFSAVPMVLAMPGQTASSPSGYAGMSTSFFSLTTSGCSIAFLFGSGSGINAGMTICVIGS